MRGPPVVLTNTLGRPVTNVISGAVPMVVVNTLGEPVTLVNSGGEPVTLFNADGTAYGDLARLIALSPSLLIWPAQGAGWQGTSGGTLAASGQPLGLGADLSQLQGKTLSEWLATAPELVTNGSFDSDTAWTKGGNWTISGGAANKTASGTNDNLSQTGWMTLNSVYVLTVTLTRTAGIVSPFFGSTFLQDLSASGTYTIVGRCAAGAVQGLLFSATSTFVGSIDNISIKELPGNHLRAGTWASPSNSARGTFQNNAINFDGINDYYSLLNAISITTNMTVVRAFKRASAGINSVGIGQTTAFNPYDHWWLNSNNINYSALGPTVRDTGAANTNTGSFVTTACRSATLEKLRLNGTQVISVSAATASGSLTALGRISSVYNAGEISFLALFPSELTGADLTLVEQIAAATNGATLS